MNLLLDANVSFLLLVGGLILAVLALFTPGTGFIEIGALFVLVLSGYGMYNLPINGWAMGVLLVGMVAYVFSIRRARQWLFLAVSMLAMMIGSIFMFSGGNGTSSVHPLLAILVAPSAVGFMWMIGRKSLEASNLKPMNSLDKIIGMAGVAKTAIHQEGTVYVGSEEWSGRSETLVPSGSKVRVIKREGLVLEVEALPARSAQSTE